MQSIQTNYLPPFISYLWPLVHHGVNLWAVDHPPLRDTTPIKFVLKYDLLIWNQFYRFNKTHPSINGDIVYPKVLILAPDWFTCENTYQHLSDVTTDLLKNLLMCCIYEGQNNESELYRKLLQQGCDLLIATPTIVQDLIQKRHIHFEQLQLIVVSLLLDLQVPFLFPYSTISTINWIFFFSKQANHWKRFSILFNYIPIPIIPLNISFSHVLSIKQVEIFSRDFFRRKSPIFHHH